MRLHHLLFVAAAVASILVLPIAHAKTLRLVLSDDATTLDPHVANLAVNNRLLNNIYEGLARRDRDFKIVPSLAVSWSQPDAKTWRFELRPGVKFHDGSAFTADDVVFSVGRALHPLSSFRDALQGVASAKRVDDLTVDLLMAEPNPVMLLHLLSFNIMSKAWCIKHNVQNPQNYTDKEDSVASRTSNGTGPFMLKSRAPDVKTVLVEHPQWWNRAAADCGNVTALEWTPIKQNSTRMAALLSGSIDSVTDPPLQDRARFKNMPEMKLQTGSEARVHYLAFDQSRDELLYSNIKGKNPFKDLRVRQAMAHAIDAELIINKVNRGYGRPTALLIGKDVQGYAPELDQRLPVDIPRAKKLMAEAGYASGFEVTLDCLNQSPFGEYCQALASQLAPIGIKLSINMVSFSNIFPKLRKFDTSLYVMGYGSNTMDALQLFTAQLQSVDAAGALGAGDGNYGRYANPKLDALIKRIKIEPDMTKRNALIHEALTIARDDLAVIPFLQVVVAWAMRKNIDAPYVPDAKPYFYRFSVN